MSGGSSKLLFLTCIALTACTGASNLRAMLMQFVSQAVDFDA